MPTAQPPKLPQCASSRRSPPGDATLIRILHWPARFTGTNADHDLPTRLQAELPGLLNRAVQGGLNWQTEGLAEPDAVRADTDAYRLSENMLQQWVADEGWTLSPGMKVAGKELNDSWVDWTERVNGRRGAGKDMAQRLRAAGCTRLDGRPVWWKGIGKLDE